MFKALTLSLTEPAEIRWAYYTAATLTDWTLTGGSDGRSVVATVTSSDAVRVSQAPLRFVVPSKRWAWPVITLQLADGRLTARLGPQEKY